MMKNTYFIVCLAVVSVGLFAFQQTNSENGVQKFIMEHLQSAGGQFGFTGAPGEANCTQCHIGSTQDGTSENQFTVTDDNFNVVTEYTPGNSYTVSLQLFSNPAKKGFSSVALDAIDENAGSFTGLGIAGTQDFSFVGRDYVSHTATSNTSAVTLWTWVWDAPTTSVGDVTFYIASNVTNNNGTISGDVIYLSQHTVSDASVGLDEYAVNDSGFTAGYSPEGNNVTVNFNSLVIDIMHFNIVDLNGKSMYSNYLPNSVLGANKHTISLPSNIKNGMYVVHCFVGNKAMSAKFLVTKS